MGGNQGVHLGTAYSLKNEEHQRVRRRYNRQNATELGMTLGYWIWRRGGTVKI